MKMNYIILILSLIPLVIFGQPEESESSKGISIGFTFSPDYCYRTIKPEPSNQDWIDDINSFHVPKFGYTVGINSNIRLSKRIVINFGLSFSNKGYQTKRVKVAPFETAGDYPDEMKVRWNMFFLDIPLKGNYYFTTNDFKLYLTVGTSANIFINQKRIRFEYDPDNKLKYNSTEGFNKVGFAIIGGIGLDYSIHRKLYVRFEPTFRYSLTPVDNWENKSYLYSFGTNIGLYYKLN